MHRNAFYFQQSKLDNLIICFPSYVNLPLLEQFVMQMQYLYNLHPWCVMLTFFMNIFHFPLTITRLTAECKKIIVGNAQKNKKTTSRKKEKSTILSSFQHYLMNSKFLSVESRLIVHTKFLG